MFIEERRYVYQMEMHDCLQDGGNPETIAYLKRDLERAEIVDMLNICDELKDKLWQILAEVEDCDISPEQLMVFRELCSHA